MRANHLGSTGMGLGSEVEEESVPPLFDVLRNRALSDHLQHM